MEQFVGLDISQAMTHLCVVDDKGKKIWQGKCPTNPEDIAKTIRDKSPSATLIGLESGALSPWLWHSLNDMVSASRLRRCPSRSRRTQHRAASTSSFRLRQLPRMIHRSNLVASCWSNGPEQRKTNFLG